MIADLEKIASDYLRTHTAVAALSTRFVGKTPTEDTGGTHDAWVRVAQLAAPNVTRGPAEHLVAYLLQLDVYASDDGGQPEANTHARTIRAALHDDFPGQRTGAVVTNVRFTGHLRLPDTEFKPARERVVLTVEIRAHS